MENNMHPARVAALLYELVAEVGLDFEEVHEQRFRLDPALDVDAFTDAVFAAEYRHVSNYKPLDVRAALRAQVRARVLKHFVDAHQEGAA
jgi:uncharacterized protein (DUF2267 family)